MRTQRVFLAHLEEMPASFGSRAISLGLKINGKIPSFTFTGYEGQRAIGTGGNNMDRKVLITGLLALAVMAAASFATAQTSRGSVAGTVKDSSGAVVIGAGVSVTNEDMGFTRETTTNDSGVYYVDALVPGTYKVKVSAPGLTTVEVNKLEVHAATIVTVDVTLKVSPRSEVVVVEAGTTQEVERQSGELSGEITQKEVSDIPIIGLNPISLALTLPGVTQPASRDDFTNGVGFSVNGTRPRANNFLIDGQDNNDLSITGQAFQPQNLEAISEVKVLTNAYSAEFGKGGGSVTNVITRGGTNEFHGSAWNLFRNSALNSMDAADKPPAGTLDKKAVSVENTFGFAFGGPILKNKVFFFGTAQWDRTRSTATDEALRIPTAAGVAALQSLPQNARIAALLSGIGDLRGDPNSSPSSISLGFGRPSVQTGLVTPSGISQFQNSYETLVRGDYIATDKDTISARYWQGAQTFAPDTFANPGQLPGFRTQQGGPSRFFGSSWTHQFGPRAVNETRFTWNFINFQFGLLPSTASNPAAAGPTATINGNGFLSGAGIGVDSGFPQGRNNQTWQIQDMVSASVGRHTIKLGFDLANITAEQAVPFNSRGTITYNSGGDCGGVPCTALANYIDDFTGSAGSAAKVFGSPLARPDQTLQAYYFEDQWRVYQRLTVTMGVRYEYAGTPLNVLAYPTVLPELGQFTGPYPTRILQKQDKNNWAPRLSFAYTPSGLQWLFGKDKTVIRGGYGMFYDGLFNNILVNSAASPPNVVGGSIIAPSTGRGTANASALVDTIAPSALNPALAVTSVVSDIASPVTHQWNLDIQREVPGGFVFTAAYVGTAGVRLFGNDELNYRINGVRINTARGAVTARDNGRHSSYHGAQFSAERRMAAGLLLRASYTFSKTLDNGSEVFTTSGGSTRIQDFLNPGLDKGLSAFHRKHRFSITYLYEIPTIRSQGSGWAPVKALTRDWQLSGTYSYQSGAPETIFVGGIDTNNDGNAANGRPNIGNLSAPFNSIGIDGSLFGVPTPAGQFFEIQNFLNCDDVTIPCNAAQPADTFHFLVQSGVGNVGRNTVTANGRNDWTVGVTRRFKMPMRFVEKQELEFRTELFNPFNHPNRGIPTLDALNPDFNNNEITRFGHREIRMWLKYKF